MKSSILQALWRRVHFRGYASKKRLEFVSSTSSSNRIKSSPFKPSSIVLLAVPLATFALGVWQTKRRTWKLNLIQELTESQNKPPIELPATPEECRSVEYQKVRVRGTFDYSRSVLIGPRSLIKNGGDVHSSSGLMGSNSSSGWWCVNPFKLSNRDEVILINRGWIPLNSPEGYNQGQIEGEVELICIPRKSERKNQYTPPIKPDAEVIHTRNVPVIAEKLGTSPIYLDSCETVPGGPIGGQTRVTLANDHFSYMLTWFSLSGITFYMWLKKFALRK
ncbi:surfeit locus protein 1 [Lepeophtheirus salmonis]|uniref:surfeit locus protein 1 n=1 Tax=Lepeophtheirus salmonis TaxID=72036 RepID=UPI001AE5E7F9|nr:surfeit locus protein 1-like [Lepeophtheirus salmonis]